MAEKNLKSTILELEKIVAWFEKQEEVDVEAGLEKVKTGVALIKSARSKIKNLKNEFEKVKKDLE